MIREYTNLYSELDSIDTQWFDGDDSMYGLENGVIWILETRPTEDVAF